METILLSAKLRGRAREATSTNRRLGPSTTMAGVFATHVFGRELPIIVGVGVTLLTWTRLLA